MISSLITSARTLREAIQLYKLGAVKMRTYFAPAFLMGLILWTTNLIGAPAEKSQIGQKVGAFKLHDCRGAEMDSTTFQQNALTVVAFLGTECPLARLYGPRLAELSKEFESKKVGFIAIDSNEQDTMAEMQQYARASQIEFPFLKDPSNQVADAFGAMRTPQVFVLDQQMTIRYQGRIDDQYGIGFSRKEPTSKELKSAIDEMLSGKDVSTAFTPTIGCHIGRVNRGKPHGDVTYTKDIAGLFQEHCVACHRTGEVGPFALSSYEDAVNWSSTIKEVVEEKRMPPWHAETEIGTFKNDRRLTDEDQKKLFTWIENGMPQGNPADLPAPPHFAEGWQIPKPDVVYAMEKPYSVPATGTVEYQYFPINAEINEDKWIVAAEARPGNRAVVHHLILYFVPPGFQRRAEEASLKNSLAVFAPGMPAWQAPPGMARKIPAGSKLFIQAHYTPNGAATTDLSSAGLVFVDAKDVRQQLMTDAVINFRLRIPPKQDNVMFKAEYTLPRDTQLVSLFPHMHLRGKAFRIESVDKAGTSRTLLNVPRYDFNWQNTYVFGDQLVLPEGTKLICSAWYDNSEKNPANPDPSQTVGWGDQTWEEMFVAQFESVAANQDFQLGLPKITPAGDGEYDVRFRYLPNIKAEAVYLAGTFNKWVPNELKMEGPDSEGFYSTTVRLKPGVHEYKYVIDGKNWRTDPGNPSTKGQYDNSVLEIKDSPDRAVSSSK